jgi:hypothetical protein
MGVGEFHASARDAVNVWRGMSLQPKQPTSPQPGSAATISTLVGFGGVAADRGAASGMNALASKI